MRSKARIRCIASGRQAGKSRTLAVLALHEAFTVPGSLTLLVSAGEQASKDLLAVVSALAQAPLLGGSVVDDTKQTVTLTSGSEVRSVPASARQIRGLAVDLLILDEACFIPSDISTRQPPAGGPATLRGAEGGFVPPGSGPRSIPLLTVLGSLCWAAALKSSADPQSLE